MLAGALFAHHTKTEAIDEFCQATRSEFIETAPHYFAGPDPWVDLEAGDSPASLADVALAAVYYEGTRIKWLVLQMQPPGGSWFETTDYFFDDNGLIQKRERRLDERAAHIQVREDRYFQGGKLIRTNYHHDGGKQENWETFYDPDAPSYTRTSDLPRLFSNAGLKHVAGLAGRIQPSRFFYGLLDEPDHNAEF